MKAKQVVRDVKRDIDRLIESRVFTPNDWEELQRLSAQLARALAELPPDGWASVDTSHD